MKKLFIMFIVIILPVAAKADPIGKVKFCRDTDLIEPARTNVDKADIRLPPGLLLDDYGRADDPDPFEHRWQLTIITLKPLEIPPHIRCVTIPAVISPLSKVHSVYPADHRDLEIVGVGNLDGQENLDIDLPPSWDFISNLHATVEREFK